MANEIVLVTFKPLVVFETIHTITNTTAASYVHAVYFLRRFSFKAPYIYKYTKLAVKWVMYRI